MGKFKVSNFFQLTLKFNKSLFIDEFIEDISSHKVKFINEKKGRVMVLHIENLTKPLYRVFPKRLDAKCAKYFFKILVSHKVTDFILPMCDLISEINYSGCPN